VFVVTRELVVVGQLQFRKEESLLGGLPKSSSAKSGYIVGGTHITTALACNTAETCCIVGIGTKRRCGVTDDFPIGAVDATQTQTQMNDQG